MFSIFQFPNIEISKYHHSKRQQFETIFCIFHYFQFLKLHIFKRPHFYKIEHFIWGESHIIIFFKFQLLGPNLLLGRTSFSTNLLLGLTISLGAIFDQKSINSRSIKSASKIITPRHGIWCQRSIKMEPTSMSKLITNQCQNW